MGGQGGLRHRFAEQAALVRVQALRPGAGHRGHGDVAAENEVVPEQRGHHAQRDRVGEDIG